MRKSILRASNGGKSSSDIVHSTQSVIPYACNRYRTLPHGWKPVHHGHGATTSHRYCDSSTGCQYDDVLISRSPFWFSSAWVARHLVTWQRGLSARRRR